MNNINNKIIMAAFSTRSDPSIYVNYEDSSLLNPDQIDYVDEIEPLIPLDPLKKVFDPLAKVVTDPIGTVGSALDTAVTAVSDLGEFTYPTIVKGVKEGWDWVWDGTKWVYEEVRDIVEDIAKKVPGGPGGPGFNPFGWLKDLWKKFKSVIIIIIVIIVIGVALKLGLHKFIWSLFKKKPKPVKTEITIAMPAALAAVPVAIPVAPVVAASVAPAAATVT